MLADIIIINQQHAMNLSSLRGAHIHKNIIEKSWVEITQRRGTRTYKREAAVC